MNRIPDSVAIGIFWLLLALGAMIFDGCSTTVKHEVPQLEPVSEAIKKIVVKDCERPTLKMRPIGTDVVIDIHGDKVTANEGGVALLQDYVKAQRVLKP